MPHLSSVLPSKDCHIPQRRYAISHTRPRAQFIPLSPIINLDALVRDNESLNEVRRIPLAALEEHTVQSLEQLVYLHVVIEGRPLVLEGWGSYLPPWLFTSKWLKTIWATG